MPGATAQEGGELRKRAAKGVVWTAITGWGNELTRLVVFIVLARLLTPEDFGLAALALVFIMMTQVIADQGLADAVIQRKDLEPEHLDSAFWLSLAIGLLLAGVLAACAIPISALLGQEELAPVLAVLTLAIPIGSLSLVQRAVLTRRLSFRSLALRTLVSIGVGASLGIAAAIMGFGVWSLVVQHLASPVVGMFILWRVSDWRPRLRYSHRHGRDLFSFGVNVVASRLLTVFSRRSDELVIGGFLGAASLGLYTVAYRMVRLLLQVTSNLVDKVAYPVYARVQDDPRRLAHVYARTTSYAMLLALPAFTAALVMAPELLVVLFGDQWRAGVPLAQIVCVLGMLQLLSQLSATVIRAAGKPSWQTGVIALTTVLKLVAVLVAVRHGLVAVAAAAALVGVVTAPAWYLCVRRLMPITLGEYLGRMRAPVVASALAAGAMLGVRAGLGDGPMVVTLVAGLAAGGVVYLAALAVLARPLVDEALQIARSVLPAASARRRPVPIPAEVQRS